MVADASGKCVCEGENMVWNKDRWRCEESMEGECPGWWHADGNGCVDVPYENCWLDRCKFCIMAKWRNDDGSIEYGDHCIHCDEGTHEEDG